MGNRICEHISNISEIKIAERLVCEECEKLNGRWVHLRTCQSCGVTLCCDSSPGKHMTRHAHESGHPVASSAEPNEKWLWCYTDEVFVEYE